MIFPVPVSIKEIVSMGRDFPWTKPSGLSSVWRYPGLGAWFCWSEVKSVRDFTCPLIFSLTIGSTAVAPFLDQVLLKFSRPPAITVMKNSPAADDVPIV